MSSRRLLYAGCSILGVLSVLALVLWDPLTGGSRLLHYVASCALLVVGATGMAVEQAREGGGFGPSSKKSLYNGLIMVGLATSPFVGTEPEPWRTVAVVAMLVVLPVGAIGMVVEDARNIRARKARGEL